jgi:hypothetical protein
MYAGARADNLAKLDDVTFAVDGTFGPPGAAGLDGHVGALAAAGGALYAGGAFTSYRGVANSALRIAKLDPVTGSNDTTFSPVGASANGFNARVWAIAATGSDVYVAGDFTQYQGIPAFRLAKLSGPKGELDEAFSPASGNGFDQNAHALALDGADLFVGGQFTTYRGNVASAGIVKLDRLTGLLDLGFSPGTAGFDQQVDVLAVDAKYVYAGGPFGAYRITGSANRIARLDRTTGDLAALFGPPGPTSNGFNGQVQALAIGPGAVHVGGAFSRYQDAPDSANRLAKLDLTTGAIDGVFSPPGATTNGFESSVSAVALATPKCDSGCGPVLLVGGSFSTYRGKVARGLVALDPATGAVK